MTSSRNCLFLSEEGASKQLGPHRKWAAEPALCLALEARLLKDDQVPVRPGWEGTHLRVAQVPACPRWEGRRHRVAQVPAYPRREGRHLV